MAATIRRFVDTTPRPTFTTQPLGAIAKAPVPAVWDAGHPLWMMVMGRRRRQCSYGEHVGAGINPAWPSPGTIASIPAGLFQPTTTRLPLWESGVPSLQYSIVIDTVSNAALAANVNALQDRYAADRTSSSTVTDIPGFARPLAANAASGFADLWGFGDDSYAEIANDAPGDAATPLLDRRSSQASPAVRTSGCKRDRRQRVSPAQVQPQLSTGI